MELEGKVLGNRYELIEKIGAGGMATVYKARCRLLNRYVAVKVLREEYTHDAEFLARFKVEAQAAASLSHPNIISVYDVGSQDDIHYIVMEYVKGQTLKEYILEKGTIYWKKAINIVLQICSALEHAHHNKIIHHDIKPHNIMITPGLVTKVMDFGIARAVTSSTLTNASNAIGSVHYFSPEQARGGYTDEKSDLYSLGIVFYEMLTGKVPFDADTPVAVALKHLEDEIEPPKKLNPNIPDSVNNIVVKATRKNKADRYSSAQEMIRDLYNALESPEVDDQETVYEKNIQYSTKGDSQKEYNKNDLLDKNDEYGGESMENDNFFEEDSNKKSKKKKNKKQNTGTVLVAIITGIILFMLIAVGIGWVGYKYFFGADISEMEVPDIVGMQFEQAKTTYTAQKITVVGESFVSSDEYEKGQIISQDPEPGKSMKVPGTIRVVVSEGKGEVTVPDVVNIETKEAKYKLEELGLVVTTVNEYNDDVAKGYIFKQSPLPNTTTSKGAEVEIYISDGPLPQVKVPNLKGLTEAEAKKEIENNRLTVGNVEYIQDKNAKTGVVVSQSIYQGTKVEANTEITITINNYNAATDNKEEVNQEEVTAKQVTKNLIVNLESTRDVVNKASDEEFVLKVETEGNGGKRLVYAKVHTKADKQVVIPITGSGSVFVKVYIDDSLNSEQTWEF